MQAGLSSWGSRPAPRLKKADVVVLNTCVVRQSAEDTATGLLGRLRPIKQAHPERVIAVMGCMVGPKQVELRRRFPQVDVWARPQQFAPILEVAAVRSGADMEGLPRFPGSRQAGGDCICAYRSRL